MLWTYYGRLSLGIVEVTAGNPLQVSEKDMKHFLKKDLFIRKEKKRLRSQNRQCAGLNQA